VAAAGNPIGATARTTGSEEFRKDFHFQTDQFPCNLSGRSLVSENTEGGLGQGASLARRKPAENIRLNPPNEVKGS